MREQNEETGDAASPEGRVFTPLGLLRLLLGRNCLQRQAGLCIYVSWVERFFIDAQSENQKQSPKINHNKRKLRNETIRNLSENAKRNRCQAREKNETGAKREKTCDRCRVWENMRPVTSAGKHATGVKNGKTCNWCQARENLQPPPSSGKHATGTKRGKTCDLCQVWEKARK